MYRREFMKFVGITIGSRFIPAPSSPPKEKILPKEKTIMVLKFCQFLFRTGKMNKRGECYTEMSEIGFKRKAIEFAEYLEKEHPLPKDACWYITWSPKGEFQPNTELLCLAYGGYDKLSLVGLCSEISSEQFSNYLDWIKRLRGIKKIHQKLCPNYCF